MTHRDWYNFAVERENEPLRLSELALMEVLAHKDNVNLELRKRYIRKIGAFH